jgi:hypothetical protein
VTELALIFILDASGVLLWLTLVRWPPRLVAGGAVERIGTAVERALTAFLGKTRERLAVLGAGVALGSFVAFAIARDATLGAGVALGVVLGAGLGVFVAHRSALEATRASVRSVAGARLTLELALGSALRGSGAGGVLAQALGPLGAIGLFVAEFVLQGGTNSGAAQTDVTRAAARALSGYALGAALAALTSDSSSAAYFGGAEVAARQAALRDASIAPHDARNPVLVSRLVGAQAAVGARAAGVFAVSALISTLALTLATELGTDLRAQLQVAALPLALMSFALIASALGLSVARPLEAEDAGPALLRGELAAAAVWSFGLGGASYWLFPEGWPWIFAAGLAGLVGSAFAVHALLLAGNRGARALREVMDTLPAGVVPSVASGIAWGLFYAAAALVWLGVTALAAEAAGKATGLHAGGTLGLLAALAGAQALLPFAFGARALALTAESARGIASMSGADATSSRRVQRLAESSQPLGAIGGMSLSLTAVLATLAFPLVGTGSTGGAAPSAPSSDLARGWVAVLGFVFMLVHVASGLRRGARGARDLCLEADRQIVDFPADLAATEVRPPSYRASEELASRAGRTGAWLPALVGLGVPVVLGSGLWLVYRGAGSRFAAEVLATFVVCTAVTALGAALAVDGARAVLAGARRASRPEGDPASFAASVTGDALSELIGSAAGTTACSLALLAASVALMLVSLFS